MRAPLALIVLFLAAAPALAQEEPTAVIARRELIAEAQAARDAGEHARAAELALRASRLRESPSLQLFLAQEQAQSEQLIDAYANARTCEVRAQGATALESRDVIEATCAELARTLRERIALLVLRLPEDASAEGLEVDVDGRTIAPELLGVPYAVMPGVVRVLARGPSGQRFVEELTVAAGEQREVVLALTGVLEPASIEPSTAPEPAPPTAAAAGGLSPVIFGVGAGLTGVVVGVAVLTGVLALDARDRFEVEADGCAMGVAEACDRGRAARGESEGYQLATNTLWGVAAAFAVATAITIPFTDFAGGEGTTSVSLHPLGGVHLKGRF